MNTVSLHGNGKVIIVSAPSGAGKTSIVKRVIEAIPSLAFSVSATSREARKGETDGRDYYFLSPEEFREKIKSKAFIEWEEVYAGHYYGTLKSEVDRLWSEGRHIIFDVDVKGGVNLKKIFRNNALSIFIMPPSVEELEKRLHLRKMDSEDKIKMRVAKAVQEIGYAARFDEIVVNDILESACSEAVEMIEKFLK